MHKLPADGHSDAEARYKQGCHSTLVSALTRGRTSPNRPANTVARGRSGILSTGRLNAWLATVCMRAAAANSVDRQRLPRGVERTRHQLGDTSGTAWTARSRYAEA